MPFMCSFIEPNSCFCYSVQLTIIFLIFFSIPDGIENSSKHMAPDANEQRCKHGSVEGHGGSLRRPAGLIAKSLNIHET